MPQLRDSSSSSAVRPDVAFSRIFGIETELGVSVTRTAQPVDPARAAMTMFAPVVTRQRATNTYLTNGARLYLDVGSHPEYASPEARTPAEALTYDLAGETIMRRLGLRAKATLAEETGERGLALHLYKNNLDSQGSSFGCHENYLLRRSVALSDVQRALIPFLSTRLLWAGAGHLGAGAACGGEVAASGGLSGFVLSQRAGHLDDTVSSSTTRSRPMVNTRDEPHADPNLYRRLHVIVGDSNRSQTATWLRLATTHLVLCMLENGDASRPDSAFARLLAALPPTCSGDPLALMKATSLGGVAALRDATRVQRLFQAAAADFAEEHRQELDDSGSFTTGELEDALAVWNEVVSASEDALSEWDTGDASAPDADSDAGADAVEHTGTFLAWCAQRQPAWVEWAAKYRVMAGLVARRPNMPGSVLRQIDLSYHDLLATSPYDSLVSSGVMPVRVDVAAVSAAVTCPPAGTRAQLRGDFVRRATASAAEWSCDWTHLEVHSPTRASVRIMDPFDTTVTDDIAALFQRLRV